jgi:hypothetical protein
MATEELNNLRLAKDWVGAEKYCLEQIANYPDSTEFWFCLSEAYGGQNKWAEALYSANRSVALDPFKYQGWAFLGNGYAGNGNWAGVESAARRTLDIAPGLPQAHWLLSHCAMAANQWGEAWAHMEYGVLFDRRKVRAIGSKAWEGQDVNGKTLFVWCEQGAGDAIQYARFLALLKEKTEAYIIFETRSALVNLCQDLADLVVSEQPDKATCFSFDYHCALMDIPRILGLDTEDISGKPYFDVPVREDGKGKIGLVWKGYAAHGNDINRSIPDELLDRFKDIKDLVAIQPGADTPDWLPNLAVSDFHSTAMALKGMKVLLTVDTSTAHLAGALGIPTIMIAPMKNTEARWAWGDKTPWYDSWQIVHATTFEEGIKKAKELLNGY